jgi:hypothetical protein
MVQNNIQTGARGRNAGHKTVVEIHTFLDEWHLTLI